MTDISLPAEKGGAITNSQMSHALGKGAGHEGYIVDGVDISKFYSELDETGVNSFAEVSQSGLDLTVDGGEAYLYGWYCRDRQTTVSLPADTTGTVYVGYDVDATLPDGETPATYDNIIIGTPAAFNEEDPRQPLYDFETDSSSILSTTDARYLGRDNLKGPWLDADGGGTVSGRLTLNSGTVDDYLQLDNGSSGDWFVNPYQRQLDDGSHLGVLDFKDYESGVSFSFTENEEFMVGNEKEFAVKSTDRTMIYVQSGQPSDASEGDLWVDTS